MEIQREGENQQDSIIQRRADIIDKQIRYWLWKDELEWRCTWSSWTVNKGEIIGSVMPACWQYIGSWQTHIENWSRTKCLKQQKVSSAANAWAFHLTLFSFCILHLLCCHVLPCSISLVNQSAFNWCTASFTSSSMQVGFQRTDREHPCFGSTEGHISHVITLGFWQLWFWDLSFHYFNQPDENV